MASFASTQPDTTRDGYGYGYDYVTACQILADHGATIVGLNCDRGPVGKPRRHPDIREHQLRPVFAWRITDVGFWR